jgi:hypothetical protein
MAPQSVKEEGASERERLFVAVSDYTLSEETEGRPAITHAKEDG